VRAGEGPNAGGADVIQVGSSLHWGKLIPSSAEIGDSEHLRSTLLTRRKNRRGHKNARQAFIHPKFQPVIEAFAGLCLVTDTSTRAARRRCPATRSTAFCLLYQLVNGRSQGWANEAAAIIVSGFGQFFG